jgi:hypothetical protein
VIKLIKKMPTEDRSLNAALNLIKSSNYKVKIRDEIINIKVTETESNALFFTLIILFLLDGLTVLIYFQLLRIIEGIVSLIIEIIIIILLFLTYSQYNDVETIWTINPLNKKIEIVKKYEKRTKKIILNFKEIESIAISRGKFIKNRYYLSLLMNNSKRIKIIYDNEKNCQLIGKKISELVDVPVFDRNFFKIPTIYLNFIFLYLIIMATILSIMDLELILGLLLILFFRNALLLISFIDVYLIKEWVKDSRDYKKKYQNYKKKAVH